MVDRSCPVWWCREDGCEFRELPLIMPPRKVCPQCNAVVPIRLKVCKSCQHVFRAKRQIEHTLPHTRRLPALRWRLPVYLGGSPLYSRYLYTGRASHPATQAMYRGFALQCSLVFFYEQFSIFYYFIFTYEKVSILHIYIFAILHVYCAVL